MAKPKTKPTPKPETSKLSFQQYVERYGKNLPSPVVLINYQKYLGVR